MSENDLAVGHVPEGDALRGIMADGYSAIECVAEWRDQECGTLERKLKSLGGAIVIAPGVASLVQG